MKGSYQVIARNNKVQIKLTISRNLTILQGNSATGKTTLIELIAAYDELGEDSGASSTAQRLARSWRDVTGCTT